MFRPTSVAVVLGSLTDFPIDRFPEGCIPISNLGFVIRNVGECQKLSDGYGLGFLLRVDKFPSKGCMFDIENN